jgi:hypothetical protein
MNTYVAGNYCFDNAIDSAGNIWVANAGNGTPGTAAGDSNITEMNSSGKVIGTYVAGTGPIGIATDQETYGWKTTATEPRELPQVTAT